MIKIDQLQSKKDQNYIQILIVDSIVSLESDSYRNHRPNSLESKFESLTIQFWVPNHLSLVQSDIKFYCNYENVLKVSIKRSCRECIMDAISFKLFWNFFAQNIVTGIKRFKRKIKFLIKNYQPRNLFFENMKFNL